VVSVPGQPVSALCPLDPVLVVQDKCKVPRAEAPFSLPILVYERRRSPKQAFCDLSRKERQPPEDTVSRHCRVQPVHLPWSPSLLRAGTSGDRTAVKLSVTAQKFSLHFLHLLKPLSRGVPAHTHQAKTSDRRLSSRLGRVAKSVSKPRERVLPEPLGLDTRPVGATRPALSVTPSLSLMRMASPPRLRAVWPPNRGENAPS
jgi:hypothetical protein